MMGWYGGGMGAGAWIFMGVFWVALIAVIIWLVVRLLPSKGETPPAHQPPPPQPASESPFEILDRRLALGEIDLDTYTVQRAALLEARGGAR